MAYGLRRSPRGQLRPELSAAAVLVSYGTWESSADVLEPARARVVCKLLRRRLTVHWVEDRA